MKVLDMIPEISSEPLDRMVKGCEASQILFTAFNYDLFTLLKEPKTTEQISKEIGTDPCLTEKFLNALVALQLLSKRDDKYMNTNISSTFLVKYNPFYQGNLLKMGMWGRSNDWSNLAQILKNGGIQRELESKEKNESRYDRIFIVGHAEGAMRGSLYRTVRVVSELPEFKKAKKLLDLGGGHGLYAIAFNQLNPNLESVVFDLPTVIAFTKEYLKEYGMEEKVKIMPGDFTEDDIGDEGEYDIIFVSDVFYRHKKTIFGVLKTIHKALNKDGIVVLKHWILNDDKASPLTSVLFDLKLSLRGKEHFIYTKNEYIDLLKEAGFNVPEVIDISTPSSPSVIVVAKK